MTPLARLVAKWREREQFSRDDACHWLKHGRADLNESTLKTMYAVRQCADELSEVATQIQSELAESEKLRDERDKANALAGESLAILSALTARYLRNIGTRHEFVCTISGSRNDEIHRLWRQAYDLFIANGGSFGENRP